MVMEFTLGQMETNMKASGKTMFVKVMVFMSVLTVHILTVNGHATCAMDLDI